MSFQSLANELFEVIRTVRDGGKPELERPPDSPPCRTLCLNNLPEKYNAEPTIRKLAELHGTVVGILALHSFYRRGQAFISFESLESSMSARKALDGVHIGNKKARCRYARIESNCLRERDGLSRIETSKSRKPKTIILQEAKLKKHMEEVFDRANRLHSAKRVAISLKLPEPDVKRAKGSPSKVLLMENCNFTKTELEQFFYPTDGFSGIRLVEARKVAFIDFQTPEAATSALEQCHEINGIPISLSLVGK